MKEDDNDNDRKGVQVISAEYAQSFHVLGSTSIFSHFSEEEKKDEDEERREKRNKKRKICGGK